MSRTYLRHTLMGGFVALLTLPSFSAEDNAALRQSYIEIFGQDGQTVSPFMNLAEIYMRYDRDKDGLDQADLERLNQQSTIVTMDNRAQAASRLLQNDINGDGRVEITELAERLTLEQGQYPKSNNSGDLKSIKQALSKKTAELSAADLDKNGVIEGAELYWQDDGRPQNRASRDEAVVKFAKLIIASDPNADGRLTEAESASLVAQSLDNITQEIQTNNAAQGPSVNRYLNSCPKLSIVPGSEFIALGTYEGSSLSTVTVGGQDETTQVATVIIEKGDKPLTLFVTSYEPVIWRMVGETSRVAKLIVGGREMPDKPEVMAGITGLPRDKISFFSTSNCPVLFYKKNSGEETIAKSILSGLAKQDVDAIMGQYRLDVVKIPSGKGLDSDDPANKVNAEDKAQASLALEQEAGNQYYTVDKAGKLAAISLPWQKSDEGSSETERDLFEFNPTGIMEFNPEDIVSPSKAERYTVLPQQAGLLQLQGEGKISKLPNGVWKITAPTRFPSGLAGALSVPFILPKGVPMPEGDAGHSCVFMEETNSYTKQGGICLAITGHSN